MGYLSFVPSLQFTGVIYFKRTYIEQKKGQDGFWKQNGLNTIALGSNGIMSTLGGGQRSTMGGSANPILQ